MKFHKRPVEDHEIALAMAVMACGCGCNCSAAGDCGCPPIPTHQIQYDQTAEAKNTQGIYESVKTLGDRTT